MLPDNAVVLVDVQDVCRCLRCKRKLFAHRSVRRRLGPVCFKAAKPS